MMLSPRIVVIRFLLLSLAVLLLVTGCAGQKQPQQDTKAPVVEAAMGFIDMNKAIKAHPRYNEYQTLQSQINALAYQIEAKNQLRLPEAAGSQPSDFMKQEDARGLGMNQEQQIAAKVSKKQAELQAEIDKKATKANQQAAAELQSYGEELEKNYRIPLFNVDLKLKAASLSETEAAAAKAERARLENERIQKLNEKDAALHNRIDQALAGEYKRAQAEYTAYEQQVRQKVIADSAAQQSKTAKTDQLPVAPSGGKDTAAELTQQLNALQQKQAALEEQLVEDIRNKTGQVAVEKGLDTVLANVNINIRAVDITDAVIAGLKQ